MSKHEHPHNPSSFPIESGDDAVLRMLAGASFGPDARLTLPSGTELTGDEAQVFTSAFGEHEQEQAPKPSTADDLAVVEMLRGATFGPNSEVVLPTGIRLNMDTAKQRIPLATESKSADEPQPTPKRRWWGRR